MIMTNTAPKICLFMFLIISTIVFSPVVNALDVDYYDEYNFLGSYYDSIVWVDNTCLSSNYAITIGVYGEIYDVWGYCINVNRLDDSDFEACFVKNTTRLNNCSGVMPVYPVNTGMSSNSWAEADNVNQYQSVDCSMEDGNTFSNGTKQVRRGQISYYCSSPSTPSCHLCGTTANDEDYNYYFVDEIKYSCSSDGASYQTANVRYGTSNYIFIQNKNCDLNKICDSTITETTSSSATTLPNTICRVKEGEACSVSSDCWHDLTCDGERDSYRGLCDGDLIDIDNLEYVDSCGGDGVLDNIVSYASNKACSDGGYPGNYICDPTLDNSEETSVSEVYSAVCRGSTGVFCFDDSDCYYTLDCVNSFCAYTASAVLTASIGHIINVTDSGFFSSSSSTASDNDIHYSCYFVDSVAVHCDGDETECNSECGVGLHDSTSWDNGLTYDFDTGGNYEVYVEVGTQGLYSDESSIFSLCVSGDGTYCYSCYDGHQNDDETNIDWGGHCGKPYYIVCNNEVLDVVTNETSIDYGGDCGNCDNSSIELDEDLIFLVETGQIVYPFTSDQCKKSTEVKATMGFFVIFLTLLLAVPLFILILVLIAVIGNLLGFFGGFLLTILRRKKKE